MRIADACPRDVPEAPSTARDHHQQQAANMELARVLRPRGLHRNTLVMRRSLVSDDLGAEAPAALRGTLLKNAEAYH